MLGAVIRGRELALILMLYCPSFSALAGCDNYQWNATRTASSTLLSLIVPRMGYSLSNVLVVSSAVNSV
jgi:hypothetical protein